MFQPSDAFEEMARGSLEAKVFLWAFYAWAHSFDDQVDQDKGLSLELVVQTQLNLMGVLGFNVFFQKHRDFLLPIIILSAFAYLASETRKNHPDVLERITAQVLKSEYFNVFLGVAFCVGGWEHAAAMNKKYREYNFDVEPVKEQAC